MSGSDRINARGEPLGPGETSHVEAFERISFDQAGWDDARWLGVPVHKLPADLFVLQEILVETRPELLIEAGVSGGGGTIFYATVMDALGAGEVVGVDVDLASVADAVRDHPRVALVEGSSTGPGVVARLAAAASGRRTMVALDSDHSADHVREELRLLAPLVSEGCYLVVEDTLFGRGVVRAEAGPAEALDQWLAAGQPFEVDRSREKFLATFNRGGYLRRSGGAGHFEPPTTPPRSPTSDEGAAPVVPPPPPPEDTEAWGDWLRGLVWKVHEQAEEIKRLRRQTD